MGQLKQLGTGMILYSTEFDDYLPPNVNNDNWGGNAVIFGTTATTRTWWQALYYHSYISSAKVYNDPVADQRFYLDNSSTPENYNVSYGLSGYGESGDSGMLRATAFTEADRSIGLVEDTVAGKFRGPKPLRKTWGYNRPEAAGSYLSLGYLPPHGFSFNIQLYDGHVERITIYELANQAPVSITMGGVKDYFSNYSQRVSGSYVFQKPAGYR